uniref:HTH CENPB-type domain-containing protein n=1 Tax=Plectus sambesii TaxID=2011161 RepID=A0A914VX02_9BILA
MSASKRKLTTLNIDQKFEILNALQSKAKTRKELSVEYGCDLSTIARVVQQELKIGNIVLENGNTSRKRLRKGNYEELDQAVNIWFWQMRAKDAIISGPMIQEEAKKFAEKLDIPDFEPSNSWLWWWKMKENITYHKIQGEKGTANQADYHPKAVYNADETGLFYKALPNGTLAARGEKPQSGKSQKNG